MKLTAPILKLITDQVSQGNPLWGLALANEYLSSGDPLRRAITLVAKRRLGTTSQPPLLSKLIEGARRDELPEDLAFAIGPRVGDTHKRVQHLATTCTLHHQRRRDKTSLQRAVPKPICRNHEALFRQKREKSSSLQRVFPLNRSL